MQIENISFSKEGYEQFKVLSKQEQIEFVTERLNPKDPERAEKLLTHIPNGNIVQRDEQKAVADNASGLAKGSKGNGGARQRQGTEESQD